MRSPILIVYTHTNTANRSIDFEHVTTWYAVPPVVVNTYYSVFRHIFVVEGSDDYSYTLIPQSLYCWIDLLYSCL